MRILAGLVVALLVVAGGVMVSAQEQGPMTASAELKDAGEIGRAHV